MAVRAACRVGQARVWTSSVFNVANSDSATALAKQVATWPMPWRSRPPPVPWCRRRRCTGRAATVGMMDQPSGGLAPVQGHLEGVHRELGAQVVGHGPTDHLAGAAVQDRGQIQPALLGGDGRRRCRRTRSGRARPGRTAAPPGPAPGWPWGRGGSGPAGGAVGPARVVVDLADTLQQLLVGPLAGGQAAVAPGIEAGTGDAKDPAQEADRVVCLLRRDEPAAAHRVVSLAKKAAAFFFLSGYVAFLAQDVVVAAQAAQLLALGGGQLAGPTTAGIDIDLVQPVAQGRPGDAEILGQLGDGFPAGAGQLDGLSAERCWVGRSGAWHVNSFESLLPSSVHVSGRSGQLRSWASASSRLSTNSTSLAIACPDAASRPTVLAQYCCSDAARVAQHPLDAAGSRWLQPASAAPGQQRFPQPLLAQLDRADLLGQPAGKLVLVADRLLPEAERSVDLCPVPLDRAAGPTGLNDFEPGTATTDRANEAKVPIRTGHWALGHGHRLSYPTRVGHCIASGKELGARVRARGASDRCARSRSVSSATWRTLEREGKRRGPVFERSGWRRRLSSQWRVRWGSRTDARCPDHRRHPGPGRSLFGDYRHGASGSCSSKSTPGNLVI